jgi:hypothetical protein
MSETTERYRDHAIEALRMLLDNPEKWSFNIVNYAKELIEALEANRPVFVPEKRPYQPIIAIDVDGPLHAYVAWKGPTVLDGGPVPGAMQAIADYTAAGYEVHIVSSRLATRQAICGWMLDVLGEEKAGEVMRNVKFSINKPQAILTIDDRVWLFRGVWPTADQVKAFRPWRSYNEPETAEPDMNRSLFTLLIGMIIALASTGMRSNLAPEAKRAVEEIQAVLTANKEDYFASIFEIVKKFE